MHEGLAANFHAVRHRCIHLLLLLMPFAASSQDMAMDSTTALGFSRALSIPMNAVRMYDRAMEAWTWTFGKEPGATLKRHDRDQGVIEGTARIPFRSSMLTGREETMGILQYRITIHVRAGECRTVVSEVVHTGNRSTARGGIHLGTLTRGQMPAGRVGGLGRGNVVRLHGEMKTTATERINTVIQAFESRMRAYAEP